MEEELISIYTSRSCGVSRRTVENDDLKILALTYVASRD
jgi:hypothetical protein